MLGEHFYTEVATRDHHAVGKLKYFLKPPDRGRLFDLGEQRRLVANQLLTFGDVFGPLDKGHRNPVDALLQRERQIGSILFGQRGNGYDDIGDIQTLSVRQHPADFNLCIDMFWAYFGDAQHKLSVVEQEPRTNFKRRKYFRMRQMDAVRVTRR